MCGTMQRAAALAAVLVVGCAGPAAAGPIQFFAQIFRDASRATDEIPISGLGEFAILTTGGGGVNPTINLSPDQTSARQAVTGYWPIMGFSDRAQYEAQSAVTLPRTAVSVYTEVLNGVPGQPNPEYRSFSIPAIVWGQIGPAVGQTVINWEFPDPMPQVQFRDGTTVTWSYTPVRMPDRSPQIFFQDGSPGLGSPADSVYYPTLLEASVEVARPATDPPGGGGTATTPEPASAVLLAGFMLGGLAARRARRAAR